MLQYQILKSGRCLQEESFCFLAKLPGFWDLSSPTRDWTHAPLQRKHRLLTTGLPENSQEDGFWVWGRGLTWKQEWPLRTGFMLSPNPLLPSLGLPKCSFIFFHLKYLSPVLRRPSRHRQSLPWRKRKIITCLVTKTFKEASSKTKAQMVKCLSTVRETRVQSWVGKIPWRSK